MGSFFSFPNIGFWKKNKICFVYICKIQLLSFGSGIVFFLKKHRWHDRLKLKDYKNTVDTIFSKLSRQTNTIDHLAEVCGSLFCTILQVANCVVFPRNVGLTWSVLCGWCLLEVPLEVDDTSELIITSLISPKYICRVYSIPGWWLNQPTWNTCSSNWIIFPKVRDENQKYLKPPARYIFTCWCKIWLGQQDGSWNLWWIIHVSSTGRLPFSVALILGRNCGHSWIVHGGMKIPLDFPGVWLDRVCCTSTSS